MAKPGDECVAVARCPPARLLLAASGPPLFAAALRQCAQQQGVSMLAGSVAAPAMLLPALRWQRPAVLLLDSSIYAALDASVLERLHVRFPRLRVLLTGQRPRPGLLDEVLRYRFHGTLPIDASADCCIGAVRAVGRGEYWLPRAWMSEALTRWMEGSPPPGAPLSDRSMSESPGSPLTQREKQIVGLLRQGLTNKEIARRLGIQEDTVKKHLQGVYGKVGVRRRALIALNAPQPWRHAA